ncbi:MAG: hypothetical protein IH857_04060 [Deltaproteobacteria bacterium]|nr:hypothetical protein [Deltaproteobacteria bacterium]
MGNSSVSLACRNYDRTQALLRGLVKVDGLDLQVLEKDDVAGMFSEFYHGEFDVSEFSLAELVYSISRGRKEFVGIPVFPARVFRHSFVFCNTASGIQGPDSLEGKKIGFPRVVQTACIWIRGMLVSEYKVPAKKVDWYFLSAQHWDDKDHEDEIKTRDGSEIHWLERRGEDPAESAALALKEGKIDVLGATRVPKFYGEGIKRLFVNYRDAEASYFKQTGIFPIMHVLTARKAAVDRDPDLPVKLFEVFSRARKWAHDWIRMNPSIRLVWKNHYLEEEREIFQGDPWVYGLQKNRHVISQFLDYCYDLGVSEKKISPEDLFAPNTWELTDES